MFIPICLWLDRNSKVLQLASASLLEMIFRWHACLLSLFRVLTLRPHGCSPSGSSVQGILQARILGCHVFLQGTFPHAHRSNTSLLFPAFSGRFFTTSATWEALVRWHLLPIFIQQCHSGVLKLALAETFTPQKMANVTRLDSPRQESWLLNMSQHN